MSSSCPDGEFRDNLIKRCLPCQNVCQQPQPHHRCTKYCDVLRCKATPGQFYDRLLKRCMSCAMVCGSHPSECEHQCHTQPPALSSTLGITGKSVIQKPNTRGSSIPKGLPDSAILIYSLLGLCLALLLLNLSGALLVMLRRSRGKASQPGATRSKQTLGHRNQEGQKPNQPSKVCLTDPSPPHGNSVSTAGHSSSPTETCVCVHCFPDLRLASRWETQHKAPPTIYQQALPQPLCTSTRQTNCSSSPKIICSPSQPCYSDWSDTH